MEGANVGGMIVSQKGEKNWRAGENNRNYRHLPVVITIHNLPLAFQVQLQSFFP